MNLLKEVTVGIMRYYAVNTERKTSRMEDRELIRKKQISVIRTDGSLLLLLNLALSGVVLLTIAKGNDKDPFRNHSDIHCRVYFSIR